MPEISRFLGIVIYMYRSYALTKRKGYDVVINKIKTQRVARDNDERKGINSEV